MKIPKEGVRTPDPDDVLLSEFYSTLIPAGSILWNKGERVHMVVDSHALLGNQITLIDSVGNERIVHVSHIDPLYTIVTQAAEFRHVGFMGRI